MAKNYGNRRSLRQRGGAPHQFLVIIVSFLFGYLTAVIFDINTISHWMNTQVLASHVEQKEPVLAEKPQIPPKPKFEFYTLLTNEKAAAQTKTVIPSADHLLNKPKAPETKLTARLKEPEVVSAHSNNGRYLVQVASFKSKKDAEHMKITLTLKGFDVNVVSVSHAKGNWFRVVVGPYPTRELAQKAQGRLAKNERLHGMIIT